MRDVQTITQQGILRTYRWYAPVYNLLFGAILQQGRRRMAEIVCAKGPLNILEIGVGTGLVLSEYPVAAEVHGIDICSDMLALAADRIQTLQGRSVHLSRMNAEAMGFRDNTFDVVTMPYVLSVTPDPHQLIREAARVCRPGGAIVVLNHFSGSAWWRIAETIVGIFSDRLGFRSTFRLEDYFNSEWTIESTQSVNLLGLSKIVVFRNDQ